MCEGYAPQDDGEDALEDELLCEYVDGTMDPDVRAAFEEYLCVNPDLAAHVERLRRARMLLCRYGCGCHAPDGLQIRLRRQLNCEMMAAQRPLFAETTAYLRTAALMTSTVAMLLVAGLLLGAEGETPSGDTSVKVEQAAMRLPVAQQASMGFPRSLYGTPRWSPDRPPALRSDTLRSPASLRRSDGAP